MYMQMYSWQSVYLDVSVILHLFIYGLCIHTHKHICIHRYMLGKVPAHSFRYVCDYIYIYTYIPVRSVIVYVNIYICICKGIHIFVYIYVYADVYSAKHQGIYSDVRVIVYVYILTCNYIHIYTHMYMQVYMWQRISTFMRINM